MLSQKSCFLKFLLLYFISGAHMYFIIATTVVSNVGTRLGMLMNEKKEKTSLIISESIPRLRNDSYSNIQLFSASYKVIKHYPFTIKIGDTALDTIAEIVDIVIEKLKIRYTGGPDGISITILGSEGINSLREVTLLSKTDELKKIESEFYEFDSMHYITRETYDRIFNFLLSFQPAPITIDVDKKLEEDIATYGIYKILEILYNKTGMSVIYFIDFTAPSEYKDTISKRESGKTIIQQKDPKKAKERETIRKAFYQQFLYKRATRLGDLWVLPTPPNEHDTVIINHFMNRGLKIRILTVPLFAEQIREMMLESAERLSKSADEACNNMADSMKRQSAKKDLERYRTELANLKMLVKNISSELYQELESKYKDLTC